MTLPLTALLIVRNERENIEQALVSARQIADQIVINDTGSTDGTLEFLRAQRDVLLLQNSWQDSFARARNQALEQALGQWIFWLDADDRLPQETIDLVNQLKTTTPDRLIGFEVVNRLRDSVEGGPRFLQIRMFPRLQGLCWEGTVHEQIESSAQKLGLESIHYTVCIEHHGYSNPELNKKKALRNLPLILADQERLLSDPAFAASLGDAYYILEEWARGIESYEQIKYIPEGLKKNADVYKEVPFWVGLGYFHLKDYKKAVLAFTAAIAEKPEKLEAYYHKAQCLEYLAQLEEALVVWEKCLDLKRPLTGTLNRFDILRPQALRQAALLAIRLSGPCLEKAAWWAEQLLKEQPLAVEARHVMGKVQKARGRNDLAIKTWIEGLGLNPGASVELLTDLLLELAARPDLEPLLRSVMPLAHKYFPDHFK